MDVAKAMEKGLEEIWHKEVDRFAYEFEKRARKEPQSPMSSFADDEFLDELYEALEML